MEKTLGIIGGMGPLATVKLFEKIVYLTNASSDQENLRIIIDNNTKIPDRVEYILRDGQDPREELIKSAKLLENAGADFLIMGCNTAHYFYEDIVKEINIPFINMIEETVKHISESNREIKKIGLLSTRGTIESKIYHKIFNKYGIECFIPSKEGQTHISDMLRNIKKGIYDNDLRGFYGAMEELKGQGVEYFVFACTELSVAGDLYQIKGNYFDAMEILARKAIEYAKRV